MSRTEMSLRYGCNPHQFPSSIQAKELPIEVLNGEPGYINLLDAINGWQLVRELRSATSEPAAASFKHVSPAGVAVGSPLSEALQHSYGVADLELSPLAGAYARARGADRVSCYGDWAAFSDTVDALAARVLRREFSHGVIAPAYDDDALAILRRKLSGTYKVIRIDPDFEPPVEEFREVFGITFRQARNDLLINQQSLSAPVCGSPELPQAAVRDAIIALTTLKYTQSNSVCFAVDGQIIGNGAGQQSRIHCTRIAAEKARIWWLRQHPDVQMLPFRGDLRRPDRDNATEQYLREDLTASERRQLAAAFTRRVSPLSSEEHRDWMSQLQGVTMASDGYVPFRDNIDQAASLGVSFVVQPGGSKADASVIEACDEHGITMVCNQLRLFHH
jgi:phosphoribosylaminoimidazolecarboxamide formyltransferase / IMP cyclohydrolase